MEPSSVSKSSLFGQLGWLDLVVVAGIIGTLVWYFKRKGKKEEAPVIKTIKTSPAAGTAAAGGANKGLIGKLKASGKSVVVFYGSQTGTAEEFASRLAKEATRYGLKAMAVDPEDTELDEISKLSTEIENCLAIFCMATYGEGDPTDNAQEFYDWLQNGDEQLNGLNYAVFGLGNKTYEHYNAMGKYVDKRMEQLGGNRIYEAGVGDDDGNIEDDFISWKEGLWAKVCEVFNVEASAEEFGLRQFKFISHEDVDRSKVFKGEIGKLGSFDLQKPPYGMKNPYLAPVRVNRELHRGGDRSCMHIEIDISQSKLRYESGDHVVVYPINDSELVHKIGELLGQDLDVAFSLVNVDEQASKKNPFPCPTTFRVALSHYLDITSQPRSHVLKELIPYAADAKDKEFLERITANTPEGKKLYSQWVNESCRNIVTILEDLPSVKPALDHLCELLPKLQPRFYSISSSPKVHPERIHITAVLVDYTTQTGRKAKGVATSWLKAKLPIAVDDPQLHPRVPVYVRHSQFRLPTQVQTPVILIGPGTGLAPFRGFIQERHWHRQQGKPVGKTMLFFGCRRETEDFLYQEELKQYEEDGTLTMHVAFSRDRSEKVYVTHLLERKAADVWQILNDGKGHIYVCGDAKSMARDVHSILEKVCQQHGGLSSDEAVKFIKKLEETKRYSADVWS